jgi:ADP-ribosyl-[dinitrogen reductase] hydrolase
MPDFHHQIKSVLFGVAVGDALGVPVEFSERESLIDHPVTGMRGYGTFNQPPGTWSDDSSMTFCLAESLTDRFNLHTIGQNFVKWRHEAYWTPHGEVFDIGIATRQAIEDLSNGTEPEMAGGTDEGSNGNGALMRISPLVFYLIGKPIHERFRITRQVSSITHGHIRSVIACFYYLEFARLLLVGEDKFTIYQNLQKELPTFLNAMKVNQQEISLFDRLHRGRIYEFPEQKISSGGYVLHTLEAAIWCLLTTGTFNDAVLKAVNLGGDTDTTGAVAGSLAGLLYGYDSIPEEWLSVLARKEDIEELAGRMSAVL